ncbi:MAG: glycosyltransferase [Pseudorhodoplanes sp.]|nr:glycosyltransferase [Pseudorhodoplanes sp.]
MISSGRSGSLSAGKISPSADTGTFGKIDLHPAQLRAKYQCFAGHSLTQIRMESLPRFADTLTACRSARKNLELRPRHFIRTMQNKGHAYPTYLHQLQGSKDRAAPSPLAKNKEIHLESYRPETASAEDQRQWPDKKKTEILYVVGSLDIGGTERHLVQVAPLLKKNGWSLAIYCLTHSGVQRAELEQQGITVIGPPVELRAKSRLVRFIGLWISCIKLLTILARTRPQIVHFFLPLSYLLGAPLAIASRIPIRIMSRRSLNHYQDRHPVLAWFERRLHPYINSALGNSQAVVNDLWAEGVPRSRTTLIYNGIDLTSFDGLPPRTEEGRLRFVIIIVANLIPYKGHAELIEAVAGVARRLPPGWQLWCVGRNDGLLATLERLAKEKNIDGNVKFLGPSAEVPTLLKSADISVSSSHEEGFSNAILEAMAAGLPVVATNVGGNAEAVIDGETGIIVPPRDPVSLGEALLKLALAPQVRAEMGRRGQERVRQCFSIEECAQAYSNLYADLLKEIAAKDHR